MNTAELKILSLPKVQEEIAKMMGPLRVWDRVTYQGYAESFILSQADSLDFKNAIRIPLAIDTENPERGLWGMVDWKLYNYEISDNNGSMKIWEPMRYATPICEDTSPYLALLKALAAQEGVEL